MMRRALLGVLLLLGACAGMLAREHATLPALRADWQHVRALAVRGDAQIESTAARMGAALDAGDRPTIAATWPPLEVAALAGVEAELTAKEIGPIGAQTARDMVEQFGRGVAALGGPAR